MKSEEIKTLFEKFEAIACEYQGVECWSARDLSALLGYNRWDKFQNVIYKAREACNNAGEIVGDHFPRVGKMIDIAKGAVREVDDYMLTRYACYLIAQNGDSRKPEISFAQNYFAVQTRVAEIVEDRIHELERVQAREKLAHTEKVLSGVLFERGVDSKGFAVIRSKGDQALFNIDTNLLKRKYNVPVSRPLADFLPTVSIKAKDLAAEMTSVKTQTKNLFGQKKIEKEHVDNNRAVRKMLLDRGIVPENLPASEDVKKVARRLKRADAMLLKFQKRKSNIIFPALGK
ncbi:DNA damage-inducible protein D [uncultured Fibrobacter sp.]|uniref:DNA damage-inducible protein D n=1 Tax=uncultured Fibrobacter sp. TaxID=261512 RepID=UPI0025EB64BF|nr:DNA damage-inducible protein D [uncultured Fibrobacter sp.]